jgi:SAM-dependent methyltransferase
MTDKLDAGYWNNRFENHDTPWDIGHVSTPLKEYIDQITDRQLAILIPGCGNGYEADYLLANGFTNITIIDISPVLTQQLATRIDSYAGKQLTIVTADFFALEGQFDLVLEQTFFCALDPSLREKYVAHMHHILKPGGKLAGLLFNKIFSHTEPPFGGSLQEYRQLFTPLFRINTLETCYNSVPQRAGSECFFILVNN